MESNVRNHADVFQMCFSPLRSVCKFGDHELGFHFLQELLVVVRPFNVGWLIKKLKLYFFYAIFVPFKTLFMKCGFFVSLKEGYQRNCILWICFFFFLFLFRNLNNQSKMHSQNVICGPFQWEGKMAWGDI